MSENSTDIVEYPLSILHKLGFYARKKSTVAVVCIIIVAFLEITVITQLTEQKGDVIGFVTNLEALGGFTQAIGKYAILIYKGHEIVSLVTASHRFWSSDKCPKALRTELNRMTLRILYLEKFFIRLMIAAVCTMFLSLLFGKPLPVGTWTKGFGYFYKVVLVLQMIAISAITVSVPVFDCIFLSFCVKLIVQFRILSYNFSELNSNDFLSARAYYNKLVLLIKHHAFLLRFTQYLKDVFSVAILCEYVTIAPIICSDMYALCERTNVQLMLRYASAIITQLLQLALYCIPADYVTTEAISVSDSVFASDWYSNYFSIYPSPLILVVQRSHNQRNFVAGGLIEINSRTLISVLKISWSACTVMRGLK